MTDGSTITDFGTQPNVIATVDGVAVTTGEAKAIGNYMVTTADGELKITKDTEALVITSATTSGHMTASCTRMRPTPSHTAERR